MISVDDGVIPCGSDMGCNFTTPSPKIPKRSETRLDCDPDSLNVTISRGKRLC